VIYVSDKPGRDPVVVAAVKISDERVAVNIFFAVQFLDEEVPRLYRNLGDEFDEIMRYRRGQRLELGWK
jgi:hypothetical protein